jgi:hypothetical protein
MTNPQGVKNRDYSYSLQDIKQKQDLYAKSWSLKKNIAAIRGVKWKLNYESDDYAFVAK